MTSILVVDDNPIDRRLITGLLGCIEGWNVETVNDGQEAIDRYDERPLPDIVVTDLQMPRMNGLELVAATKKIHPRLPVILITSQGSEEIALEALRAGAINYSPKSALSRDLVRTIQKVISVAEKVASNAVVSLAPTEYFDVQFEIENDAEMIWPLIEQLQSNLPPWSTTDQLQIGMALDEAMSNAMYHGNLEVESDLKECEENEFYKLVGERQSEAPYCDRTVRIQARFTPDEFEISVADQGPGFDPETVEDPRKEENLSKLSGRGLLLIRSFMDDVWHNETGNKITMVKRRKPVDPTSAV